MNDNKIILKIFEEPAMKVLATNLATTGQIDKKILATLLLLGGQK